MFKTAFLQNKQITSKSHDRFFFWTSADKPQIPEGRNYMKEGFRRCHDCAAVLKKRNLKTLETNFFSPYKEGNEDED